MSPLCFTPPLVEHFYFDHPTILFGFFSASFRHPLLSIFIFSSPPKSWLTVLYVLFHIVTTYSYLTETWFMYNNVSCYPLSYRVSHKGAGQRCRYDHRPRRLRHPRTAAEDQMPDPNSQPMRSRKSQPCHHRHRAL
mmetsp:Transcript_1592/g.3366  ORF Transcript_1592/g.3366 Transcript_1592/m.3366 type:complete len:136 (-) Transcript_1592:1056-1463(-)